MSESQSVEGIAPRSDYPVLYVDDEADNLLVFRANLSDAFCVLTARSGDEALRLLEEEDVAVVLADQRMPGMSGVDLLEKIRARTPHVRRVLITAYSDQQTAIDAINRGGVHSFLVKPWDDVELRQVLLEQLERVHLERVIEGLRSSIMEKERQLGLATVRDRILHDLGGVTFRLGLLCTQMERALAPEPGVSPEQQLEKIRTNTQKMRRAVDHLVSLHSERRTVSSDQNPEPLRLGEVFEAVKVLSGAEHVPGVRLTLDGSRGALLWADRVSVTRILVNLVSNAMESLEASGRSRGRICVHVQEEAEDFVELEVSDDGPGVPESLRDRIFEERFSTKKQTGGSGTGLPTSRALAVANHGSLELVDSPRGARFRLVIPSRPIVLEAVPSLHSLH